ncbi:Flavanone 3-dioxygenase [Bertholletia excelsa]
MGEVNPAFIQAEEHRPKLTVSEAEGIPLIDLSILFNSPESPNPNAIEPLVAEIGEACRTWGFFQIINHGVPLELRQKLELTSKKFFALPVEEKRKVKRDDINPLGYSDAEHTKNVRDWKEVFDVTVNDPIFLPASPEPGDESLRKLVNRWPDYPPEFREAFEEYAKEIEKLSYRLLELISLSLGLPANRLNGFFDHHASLIRVNRYPPCPIPDVALGVGRHKDGGALTILAQDEVGGLEVKRKADGEWIRVRPTPDAYIVNLGDIIQVPI